MITDRNSNTAKFCGQLVKGLGSSAYGFSILCALADYRKHKSTVVKQTWTEKGVPVNVQTAVIKNNLSAIFGSKFDQDEVITESTILFDKGAEMLDYVKMISDDFDHVSWALLCNNADLGQVADSVFNSHMTIDQFQFVDTPGDIFYLLFENANDASLIRMAN